MIVPQTWATTTRLTRTAPLARSTSTSATHATYVRTFSYLTYVTPRPVATADFGPLFGDGRDVQPARFAAAFRVSAPRASVRWRRRNSTGSAPAAAASSSMNASLA